MSFTIKPATAARFDDVAAVLGPKRPESNVCWCLSHRIDSRTNGELRGPERGEYMRKLTRREVAPGVLAYEGDEVVGWAAVAPRAELPVARSKLIPTLDDQPVWSIICVRGRAGHRGRGAAQALVEGAFEYAVEKGAPVVEAYPVDNAGQKVDLTMAFVGLLHVFERAGFTKVADTDAVAGGFPRVLVRREAGS